MIRIVNVTPDADREGPASYVLRVGGEIICASSTTAAMAGPNVCVMLVHRYARSPASISMKRKRRRRSVELGRMSMDHLLDPSVVVGMCV